MLVNLENKMLKIWRDNNNEGNAEFEALDGLSIDISNLKVKMKEVFRGVNACCTSQQMDGYTKLIENISELDFKKIVYATFKESMIYDDGRLFGTSKGYVDRVISELDTIDVFEEYRCYEHPFLWNTLLVLVAKEGYVQ